MDLIPDIVAAEYLSGHRLRLSFSTGEIAEVDLATKVSDEAPGLLSDLADEGYFAQVFVDHDSGTIAWPNGMDWDPVVLYSLATGTPLPGHQPV